MVSHMELAETVLDESGYTDFWKNSKKPEAPGKLENLKELLVAMEEFENLGRIHGTCQPGDGCGRPGRGGC